MTEDRIEAARRMRAVDGMSKRQIADHFGDIPEEEIEQWQARRERVTAHAKMMAEARWADYRQERDARHASITEAAAASVSSLADQEILRLGALIYWCEGAKSKPWNNATEVLFVNSDPGLIRLFLAFLRVAGVVERERIGFRVQIHESADAEAAVAWWAQVVGAEPGQFQRTTLKRHNPKTIRHNTGAEYHGCLVVRVRKSRELYWKIEGWVAGVVGAVRDMGG